MNQLVHLRNNILRIKNMSHHCDCWLHFPYGQDRFDMSFAMINAVMVVVWCSHKAHHSDLHLRTSPCSSTPSRRFKQTKIQLTNKNKPPQSSHNRLKKHQQKGKTKQRAGTNTMSRPHQSLRAHTSTGTAISTHGTTCNATPPPRCCALLYEVKCLPFHWTEVPRATPAG